MDYSGFLATTPLFNGATPDEIRGMLGCLDARTRCYEAGAYIYHAGETIRSIGLVLEGRVRIENVDAWGNVSVIGTSNPGELFGVAYAAIPNEPLTIDVIAAEDTFIVFLNLVKILTTCPRACPNHNRVSTNMVSIIARDNLALAQRIFHASPRTIRGKVLSYLSYESERAGSLEFDIPYDRQRLADYLGVDRSALSAELSRMQKAGIIETHRSHFILKKL